MRRRYHQGFTLTELLITVAVAGILLAIGVPSFAEAVREGQIRSQHSRMVGSLFLARSEAIKGPTFVTLCPRSGVGISQCGDSDDWSNGWIVFVDNTIAAAETTANINSDDEILRVESAITADNTITAIGSVTGSVTSASSVSFIRYTTDGDTEFASASVMICDSIRGSSDSRAINILLTGDIRRGRTPGNSDTPVDVFNQSISKHCPEPD